MISALVNLGLGALVQPPSLAPHASRSATYARSAPFASAADDVDRRGFVAQSTAAAVGTAALAHASPARADFFGGDEKPQWKQVDLPIATESPILFDIEFDPQNPKNGWIVGNKGTFLQTTDGGATWVARSFSNLDPDEEINYRFTKLSFLNGEGWIIGKPAILLHTTDSGGSWERVPLSPKLPGDPYGIVALGRGKAELSTSAGAIYTTENAGRNWKAEVRETIDATLNRVSSSGVQGASYFSGSVNAIERDGKGAYLAVSSRGNFYLTYTPGSEFWLPHNRQTSRRITSMGFAKNNLEEGLWMTTAGGEISKTPGKADTQLIGILLTINLLLHAIDRITRIDSLSIGGHAADRHPLRPRQHQVGRLRHPRRRAAAQRPGVGGGRRRQDLLVDRRRQELAARSLGRRPADQPV